MSTPHPNPKGGSVYSSHEHSSVCRQCSRQCVEQWECRAEATEFCHPHSGQSEWTLGLPGSLPKVSPE